MPVNLSQYRATLVLLNSVFIPKKQSNIFYRAFFQHLDILAIVSVLISIFIKECVMLSVIKFLSYSLLLRGNSKRINSFSVEVYMSLH